MSASSLHRESTDSLIQKQCLGQSNLLRYCVLFVGVSLLIFRPASDPWIVAVLITSLLVLTSYIAILNCGTPRHMYI